MSDIFSLHILLVTCFVTLCKTTEEQNKEAWEELAEGKQEIGYEKVWADVL